jgi:beta-glucan synthesis-associated protein KRE6
MVSSIVTCHITVTGNNAVSQHVMPSHACRLDSPGLFHNHALSLLLIVQDVGRPMSVQWPSNSNDGGEAVPSGSSSPDDHVHPPRTPTTSNVDQPLLPPDSPSSKAPARSFSSASNFVSSPLNPNATHTVRSRPVSRGSTYFNRIASEESQALTSPFAALAPGQRGSMVLYRLASGDDTDYLLPPKALQNRDSVASSSGDSIFSLSSDSKYPSGTARIGFVPYAYDPDLDSKDEMDEEDLLHQGNGDDKGGSVFSLRGFLNLGVLILLILALLTLFVCYPVLNFYRTNSRNLAIDGNIRINGTGQSPVL